MDIDSVDMNALDPDNRPPGVPEGARLVTLAELKDRIAQPNGSLRLGPRGSYLRAHMRMWPFGLRGTIFEILGGGVSSDHGQRVFGLGYAPGVRRPGRRMLIAFTRPDAAERQLWIWTLDDMKKVY